MVECCTFVQDASANLAKTNREAILDRSAFCCISGFSSGTNFAAIYPPFCSYGSFPVFVVGNDLVDTETRKILAVYNPCPDRIVWNFFAGIFFWIGITSSSHNMDCPIREKPAVPGKNPPGVADLAALCNINGWIFILANIRI